MTNEELITDLKQFITATVSQATADLATKEEVTDITEEVKTLGAEVEHLGAEVKHLDAEVKHLGARIDQLEATMNGRFDEVLNAEIIRDHEVRITRLERTLA